MGERIIIFRPINGKEEEIIINTNAPRTAIEKALSYRNDVRANELFDYLSDFEIIQNYLEEKDYVFYEVYIKEIYYW